MNHRRRIGILIIGILLSASAQASKYADINVRQHMDNESMNKVVDARLRGMLAGTGKKATGGGFARRDCVTQIGNQDANQSLIGSEQDVIIVGDVINVCQ